jgi:deoxyribodipyrimidine photolyase-related protein
MPAITIIFPHQLYKHHPAIDNSRKIILIEEWLFFNQFNFHKQKIVLHRASMQFYHSYLQSQGFDVEYIASQDERAEIGHLIKFFTDQKINEIHYADVTDDWLEKRITKAVTKYNLAKKVYPTPNFLNDIKEVEAFFSNRKSYFQSDFYTWQRKKQNILLLADQKPVGGKWSFDADNRKKFSKKEILPALDFPVENQFVKEARNYVEENFTNNYGTTEPITQMGKTFYPTTFDEAEAWLDDFLLHRFERFGIYEDAMVANEPYLFHSVLTPMLNIGLINPRQIIEKALAIYSSHNIPLNSVEGFIRQVIGWREYIRAIYLLEGSNQRTKHFWGFTRKIPKSFWRGETGILPLDTVIKRLLKFGYTHHIERLMVMGNFMLLCEFDPDDVYKWFMEMYVDAYDWVMVPNTYGMTQFADGGLMTTKPYISGSNYILKMSDFAKGDWQQIWDGLFWRFMHVHRDVLEKNHRLGMLIKTFDNMPDAKKTLLLKSADKFLKDLDEGLSRFEV